jgi:hypothetical protein
MNNDHVTSYRPMNMLKALNHILNVLFGLLLDVLRFLSLTVRSGVELRAENLFLRKQLAFYAERKIKERRVNGGARMLFVFLSKLFAWKNALVIVKPETLIRWHRKTCSEIFFADHSYFHPAISRCARSWCARTGSWGSEFPVPSWHALCSWILFFDP